MTDKQFNSLNTKIKTIMICIITIVVIAGFILIINTINCVDDVIDYGKMPSVGIGRTDELTTTFNELETDPVTTIIILEDKYDAIFDYQVYTGDFGVEQLYYLKDQCDKYNIPIEIMLSIICTESDFTSTAKNPDSSASGYCQVLRDSAEWLYEDILNYGIYNKYDHTFIMTTNWKLNIEMGCRFLNYLYEYYGNSWETAIKEYHGGDIAEEIEYFNDVNESSIELFNTSVYTYID